MLRNCVLCLSGLSVLALVVWLLASCGCNRYSANSPAPGSSAGIMQNCARGLVDGSPQAAPPPAGYDPDEELWIIVRPPVRKDTAGTGSDGQRKGPGTGALLARWPGQNEPVPVPLEHTAIRGSISGYIATVDVKQRFVNPFDVKIEAEYVFPLPHNAAVHEFVMTVGERRIRGIIREREEAEKVYREARRQGHVAALMTQERPNIFTQKVANLEPGKRIDVDIRYFHTLAYVDGVYEFVAPLVVAPRFNPPGSTGGIEAVARDASATAGPGTQIPYLAPGERSGHDVSVEVTLDAGVALTAVESPSHAVTVNRPSPHQATIQLRASDTIPNRDFILRYRVDSDRLKAGFLTHTDPRGGFFTLMLYPPAEVEETARRPLEMIFVIDCSGSMEGWPLARTRMAMARALHGLSPEDAYQIVRFSDDAHRMHQDLIPATPGNIRRDLEALEALRSSGGTMMTRGLRAALTTRHDPERLRVVTLLTDGFIGNEIEVLRVMRTHLGEARVFSFGVGNSVNRYLMEAMARLGRGAVAYVGQDGSVQQAVDRFFQRVRCPALADPTIDWKGMAVEEVFPVRLPDLVPGRPVLVCGRFTGKLPSFVEVIGRRGPDTVRLRVPLSDRSTAAARKAGQPGPSVHPGLPCVWARKKIQSLADAAVILGNTDARELTAAIQRTALDFGLLSAFTAFVAVDSLTCTAGDHGVSVKVPVRVPSGVRYETTVGGK